MTESNEEPDGMLLPNLPEGWIIDELKMDRYQEEPYFWLCRLAPFGRVNSVIKSGKGKTARAAVLAAIAKVQGA